jgi:hypothetical protein
MNVEIISATILTNGSGTDKVVLKTNKPYPVYPFEKSDMTLTLNFDVAKGKGVEYVSNNFQLDSNNITIINMKEYIKE